MRRVVVTGMGIVSSIGNNTQEVLASLHEAKSGISRAEKYAELGFRSQVQGEPTLDPATVVDRRAMRFLGQGAAWNHVAMIYDGNDLNVYLNGELDGTIGAGGNINQNEDAPVWVCKKANEAIFLDGILDELAIFDVAITEDQLKNYMEGEIKVAVEAAGKLAISWGEIKAR